MKAKFITATTALLMSAGSAYATPVTFSTPIAVPNNLDGVYLNLLTGATGSTGSSVTGWDINLYNTNSVFTFFWNNTAPNVSGGVATAVSGGTYIDLPVGAVVSAASIFSASSGAGGPASTTAFQTTGVHTLGFRFYNEATSAINYGYMSIQNTATSGFPATILSWTFENSGSAITIPGASTGGVPEPTTWAMMLMGFGALGAAMRRTRATTRVRYAA